MVSDDVVLLALADTSTLVAPSSPAKAKLSRRTSIERPAEAGGSRWKLVPCLGVSADTTKSENDGATLSPSRSVLPLCTHWLELKTPIAGMGQDWEKRYGKVQGQAERRRVNLRSNQLITPPPNIAINRGYQHI